MAIEGKRGSLAVMEFSLPHAPTVLEPDGTIDRADSFQILDLFDQPAGTVTPVVGAVRGGFSVVPAVSGVFIVDGLYIDCDANVVYSNAQDEDTGQDLNSATVQCQLQIGWGAAGVQFAECPWIEMPKVSYVDGKYKGVIDRSYTSQMTEGEQYQVVCKFDQGDYDDRRVKKFRASFRDRN